jgi:hypothetical protein
MGRPAPAIGWSISVRTPSQTGTDKLALLGARRGEGVLEDEIRERDKARRPFATFD